MIRRPSSRPAPSLGQFALFGMGLMAMPAALAFLAVAVPVVAAVAPYQRGKRR